MKRFLLGRRLRPMRSQPPGGKGFSGFGQLRSAAPHSEKWGALCYGCWYMRRSWVALAGMAVRLQLQSLEL